MGAVKNLYYRLKAFPFEAAFAGLALVGGLSGLFHLGTSTDALNLLMPAHFVDALNVVYAVAGLCLLLGLAMPRRDLEGFGLIQLGGGVLIRSVAVWVVAGFNSDTLALYVLYGLIMWACVVRFRTLLVAGRAVRGDS